MKSSLALKALNSILAVAALIGQVSIAQSTVVVSDIRFDGELGVPVSQLQDYTQFLKGRSLERTAIMEQSKRATTEALRHHGFWKAQVTPSFPSTDVDAAHKGVVLRVTIHSGLQYRVKDVSFSGRASEFASTELREAVSLRQGDIADGNEIGGGIANLMAMFKKKGQDYFVVPSMTYDDAAHTMSFGFAIEK